MPRPKVVFPFLVRFNRAARPKGMPRRFMKAGSSLGAFPAKVDTTFAVRKRDKPIRATAKKTNKEDRKMPKMKTKSGAKKRFNVTGTG